MALSVDWHSSLICWATSALALVRWIDTLTAPLATATSFTIPKETMSLE